MDRLYRRRIERAFVRHQRKVRGRRRPLGAPPQAPPGRRSRFPSPRIGYSRISIRTPTTCSRPRTTSERPLAIAAPVIEELHHRHLAGQIAERRHARRGEQFLPMLRHPGSQLPSRIQRLAQALGGWPAGSPGSPCRSPDWRGAAAAPAGKAPVPGLPNAHGYRGSHLCAVRLKHQMHGHRQPPSAVPTKLPETSPFATFSAAVRRIATCGCSVARRTVSQGARGPLKLRHRPRVARPIHERDGDHPVGRQAQQGRSARVLRRPLKRRSLGTRRCGVCASVWQQEREKRRQRYDQRRPVRHLRHESRSHASEDGQCTLMLSCLRRRGLTAAAPPAVAAPPQVAL